MRALGLGLLGICMGLVGCGPDHRAQCEAQIQCGGGNDKDIDACTAVLDEYREFYGEIGCGDEYDAYFSCTQELAACRSMPTGQSCMTSADCSNDRSCSNGECVSKSYSIDPDKADQCDVEANAYASCVQF